MKDLSKYGVTIVEQYGIYRIKGLLYFSVLVYNSLDDLVLPAGKTLADFKQKVVNLYGPLANNPNPERYEKFMAVIEYLESVK